MQDSGVAFGGARALVRARFNCCCVFCGSSPRRLRSWAPSWAAACSLQLLVLQRLPSGMQGLSSLVRFEDASIAAGEELRS